MHFAFALIPLAALAFIGPASAQGKIFRCGNAYTNDEAQAIAGKCKLMEGGNVTVVQGTKAIGNAPAKDGVKVATAPQAAAPSPAGSRIDAGEQKARDGEARSILEAELKKAESRHADLLKEYNNGEPEKLGPEFRNHAKYLERTAELKASIERNEKDIAGLKRELGRSAGTAAR
jgi:hypothetical protein